MSGLVKISIPVNAQFKVASVLWETKIKATLNKALIESKIFLSMEILRCNR